MYDYEAWVKCHPDDLWIFDKLILAKKLGYLCGPADVAVPKSDNYIVRPCVNLAGMGIGAELRFLVFCFGSDDYLRRHLRNSLMVTNHP